MHRLFKHFKRAAGSAPSLSPAVSTDAALANRAQLGSYANAERVGNATTETHFTHSVIHMLANDLPSTNSCYNTPSNYLYVQHQAAKDGSSKKDASSKILRNERVNEPLSLDLLREQPDILKMINLNAKFNFNLPGEIAMERFGEEASRLLSLTGLNLINIKYWYENVIIPNDLYVNAVEYDSVTYKRNVLYRDEDIEILLICWMPGQKTPVHDHPDQGCLVRVLSGELHETLYNLGVRYASPDDKQSYFDHGYPEGSLRAAKHRSIGTGAVSYLSGDRGVHRLWNKSEEPAMSLHVYSPPLYKPTPMREVAARTEVTGPATSANC
jgi:predicted metal-dependent enzyme (double-stranded beta helix superfamily)